MLFFLTDKIYRVTTVLRERKSALDTNPNNQELTKSQMQYTDREKNASFLKDPPKNESNLHRKNKPYKSEIQLNKLTMGFLNYDKLKEFYKDEETEEIPIRRESDLSGSKFRSKYNPDTDKDLNIFEYFNMQAKSGGFRFGVGSEGALKRQSVELTMVPSSQNLDVFIYLFFYFILYFILLFFYVLIFYLKIEKRTIRLRSVQKILHPNE